MIWTRIKLIVAAAIGALGIGALAVLAVMLKLARSRADEAEQEAAQAKQAEANAETQQQVYQDASKAAETVRQKPEPPIDTEKRNDFDTDW